MFMNLLNRQHEAVYPIGPSHRSTVLILTSDLHLDAPSFATFLRLQGPSLASWRYDRFICAPAFSRSLTLSAHLYAARRNHQLQRLNIWSLSRWSYHLAHSGLKLEVVRSYLHSRLVRAWDTLELAQQVWISQRQRISLMWRRISPNRMERLAERVARINLAAPLPIAGGQLIVAHTPDYDERSEILCRK